jgi:hypothetical protein
MQELLIQRGIERLGTSRKEIMAWAEIMTAAGFNPEIYAIGMALQMIQAGGLEQWFKTFRPDSEMILKYKPVILDAVKKSEA